MVSLETPAVGREFWRQAPWIKLLLTKVLELVIRATLMELYPESAGLDWRASGRQGKGGPTCER